jgi:hypothetical protein
MVLPPGFEPDPQVPQTCVLTYNTKVASSHSTLLRNKSIVVTTPRESVVKDYGAACRIRTDDLRITSALLYQLS